MHEGPYAAGREFGLNVAGEESLGFVVLPQHGVNVGGGERCPAAQAMAGDSAPQGSPSRDFSLACNFLPMEE